MAQYVMEKLSEGMLGEGERIYPKLVNAGVAGIGEIADLIEHSTTFHSSDVKGMLEALARVIAAEVAQGRTVRLDGLGTFRAVLGLVEKDRRQEWKTETDRLATGRNVRVKTVNFRPDNRMLREVDDRISLERVGNLERPPRPQSTMAERLAMLRTYCAEHHFIRVSSYADLTGLSRTTASRELRTFAADPETGVTGMGRGAAKVYVLAIVR